MGRKGRLTRDRILEAASHEISSASTEPLSLSAVARRAELGMTSLYNYFPDLTELVLGVLEPVMAEADNAYLECLRSRWPDDSLADQAYAFARRFQRFWAANAAVLHLRNAMADAYNERMVLHRVNSTLPVISAIAFQMDGDPNDHNASELAMASFLMTGLERAVTVNTDTRLGAVVGGSLGAKPDRYLRPTARVFELAIRDARARVAA